LTNDKHDVVIIDDLSSGYKKNISVGLSDRLIKKQVQEVNNDEIHSIDGIFHLAAQTSVPISIEKFYTSSANNILSAIRVFDFAKLFNVPVVYASSSAVYGNLPLGNDKIERYDILSPYAQDKLTLEDYAKMCMNVYGIPSIGLRFFNVYGPRQDPSNPYSGVISIFIDRLLQNKAVIVNGGCQTRDFVFVEDVIKVIIASMEHLCNTKLSKVFNVGTGVSVTINNLLAMLADSIKVEPTVILKELPLGDPEKSSGTYGKLTKTLNIDIGQFVKLGDGLRATINFIRNEQRQ
jgi:UDP-glucose 4-epimerase